VPDRPFHHGNLRTALLDRAAVVLRERGSSALSLRELARDLGVSHGAPRSHFIDKSALLDAMAARGFVHLTAELRSAQEAATDYRQALHAVGRAYLRFVARDPALHELMFAVKLGAPSDEVESAVAELFGVVRDFLDAGVTLGVFAEQTLPSTRRVMVAALEGAASLLAAGRIDEAEAEQSIDDVIGLLLG
jgi:AcrR family transcriptional regulator